MTKKNQKAKNDEASAEIESVEQKPDLTEADMLDAKLEAISSQEEQDVVAAEEEDGESNAESSVTETSDDVSVDDLLDDVRRSLIEDETQAGEKSGWWSKKSKGKRKDPVAAPAVPDVDIAPLAASELKDNTEYLDQIDELIDLLEPGVEKSAVDTVAKTVIAPAPEPEPEVAVNVDELKKRVFSPSETGNAPEMSEVRAITLEGGEDVFVEVETKKPNPAEERWQAFENSLKSYQRYINYAVAFLGVVAVVLVSAMLYSYYLRVRPAQTVKEVSKSPFPTSMTLPGGLNFNLGRGAITNGQWNPQGPEWLEGTEICRWVAIPWNRQLEAVVRTMTQNDTIELGMSNNDILKYNVYAIQQMTLADMQKLDSNTPCLLLMLAQQDSDKRWVVTSLP